jgi:hypothetical protein
MTTSRKPRAAAKLDTRLIKNHDAGPLLALATRGRLLIRGGTRFAGRLFASATFVHLPELVAGADYFVRVPKRGEPKAIPASAKIGRDVIGGFHFAPGGNAKANKAGNAKANAGGDETPAINPCSLWDLNFRPACADPRGMALVDTAALPGFDFALPRFWADIYLTGADHIDGTSRLGATIADGSSPPQSDASGGRFKKFDYATATQVLGSHGKQLLSAPEFFAAAFGVAEKSAVGSDPVTTKLDAPRTSRFGLVQATGNLWTWGHDGHPMTPRPSIFGGDWWDGGVAGSRHADLVYWPEYSVDNIGARGRCDHLQPGGSPRKRRPIAKAGKRR